MLASPLVTHSFTAEALSEKIASRTALVGVIGIGYIGLPLAIERAKTGFVVRGYDRNPIRVDQVNHGLNYIRGIADADVADTVYNGKFSASMDLASLHECDVIVICVSIPLTANKDPDASNLAQIGNAIAEGLRPGQLVCLESAAYPGATEDVLLPLLQQTGLKPGRDFFLAYSPQRVDAGKRRSVAFDQRKIVGGVTAACLDVAAAFYAEAAFDVLRVASPRVAEMAKGFADTLRAVNIAMVNETALLCDKLGMNVWDVVEAAGANPLGAERFAPGPGVGGYDVPLGPFYLAWCARDVDSPARFMELAGEVNASMPYFVRAKITRTLNEAGRALKNAKILVIGLAYKRDTADACESPSLKVIELLDREGAIVSYHDPFIPRFADRSGGKPRRSVPLSESALREADCVVILTDHTQIDWDFVVRHGPRVVDTRNATRFVPVRPNVTLL